MIRPEQIEVYATREEWLAARRRLEGSCPHTMTGHYRIGASDVAPILGVPAFRTAWDVFYDKREGAAQDDNDDMARGRRWERIVRELYAEETGNRTSLPWLALPCPGGGTYRTGPESHILIRHPELAWAVASPDAFILDGDPVSNVAGGLECKTDRHPAGWAEDFVTVTPGWDGPWPAPRAYVLQVYWSLAVSGLPFWDIACLLPHYHLVHHRFLADPALQAQLLEEVGAWRERFLIAGEEPPVDDSDACRLYYAGRPHEAPLRPATAEEAELAAQLHRAQRDKADAEERERLLKNQLGALLKDCKGVALGEAVGRKKPPRIAWEGKSGRVLVPEHYKEQRPFLRIRGLDDEGETR